MNPVDAQLRPTITDQEVSTLPLAAGRTDLLEEIMSTPVLDRAETRLRRPAPGWLMAAAAAAAVAAIALAPTLGPGSGPDDPGTSTGGGRPPADDVSGPQVAAPPAAPAAPEAPVVPEVSGGRYVGVEVAGWNLSALYEDGSGLTLGWDRGRQWLEVVRYPADQHASYFADRDASLAGTASRLFGRDATTWAYSRDDHATMTEPADGFFFEVRAAGMPLADYRSLLEGLVQTDEAGFYVGLPEGTVTPANHDRAVRGLLEGVEVPRGFTAADVELEGFQDPYQAAAGVAGAVGCAWLDVYAAGPADQRDAALAALDGSAEWPLLLAMGEDGDYPQAFAQVAEELRSGTTPAELRAGIC